MTPDRMTRRDDASLVRVSTKSMVIVGYVDALDARALTLTTKGGAVRIDVARVIRVVPTVDDGAQRL